MTSTIKFDAHPLFRSSPLRLEQINNAPRYSVGLDDAAAVALLSATGGDASELEAHGARKARERQGNKINAALQKLENVRFLINLATSKPTPSPHFETCGNGRGVL